MMRIKNHDYFESVRSNVLSFAMPRDNVYIILNEAYMTKVTILLFYHFCEFLYLQKKVNLLTGYYRFV